MARWSTNDLCADTCLSFGVCYSVLKAKVQSLLIFLMGIFVLMHLSYHVKPWMGSLHCFQSHSIKVLSGFTLNSVISLNCLVHQVKLQTSKLYLYSLPVTATKNYNFSLNTCFGPLIQDENLRNLNCNSPLFFSFLFCDSLPLKVTVIYVTNNSLLL